MTTLDHLARETCARKNWSGTLAPSLAEEYRTLLRQFRTEVNKRAEDKMLRTCKLEGSHFAAMTEILRELGVN